MYNYATERRSRMAPLHVNTEKTGRHTTATEKARDVFRSLERREEIRKVHFGRIRRGKPVSQHRIKVKPWYLGVRLVVRGSVSIQDMNVETGNPQQTINFLLDEYPGEVTVARRIFFDFTRLWRNL